MAKRPWYKPEPTYVPPPEPEPVTTPVVKRRRRPRIASVDGPDPVDVHVGARVKLRRTLCGMSQEKLGEIIGLTFQQVQKYERGFNRISASALFRIAQALDVPVSFFFDDMPEPGQPASQDDTVTRRESLELLRRYYRLPEEARRGIYDLVRVASGPDEDE